MATNGSWAEVSVDGADIGVVWSDGVSSLNYVPLLTDPDLLPAVTRVGRLVKAANQIEISKDLGYAGVVASLSAPESKFTVVQNEGDITEVMALKSDFSGMKKDQKKPKSSYSLSVDSDGSVFGLSQVLGDVVTVRENGNWVEPAGPDDNRYYNGGVYYVNEKAVELYDKLVGADTAPSLTDFDRVLVE